MDDSKIQSFEDLIVWQNAMALAVEIYRITDQLPKDELFGLTSQLKRASSSVSANIAEGFGRRTTKDKLQLYTIAYGSILETKNFIYLCHKLGYIHEIDDILERIVTCQKLLNAFMKAHR